MGIIAQKSPPAAEKLVQLSKAGKLFETPDEPSLQKLLRWATHGVLNSDRTERIKLRSRRIGGKRYITKQWADEFIAACSAEPTPTSDSPPAGNASKALAALGC